MTETPKQHVFQAEVARILDLMVHSVYTDKEIFLRELISNASDALDKLRYLALTEPALTAGDTAELAIHIEPRVTERALLVRDNGIGMNAEELVDNLGTIARSGTKKFLEQAAADKTGTNLIGQFGVGFYSAFMVADRIEVVSRKAGTAEANRWVSEGGGGFTIEPLSTEDAATTPRGTSVLLHLKDDALSSWRTSALRASCVLIPTTSCSRSALPRPTANLSVRSTAPVRCGPSPRQTSRLSSTKSSTTAQQ